MTIKSNSYIIFSIRSNKDLKQTSSFLLRFKVTAYGHEKLTTKVRFNDLTTVLTSLLGAHFSRVFLQRNLEISNEQPMAIKDTSHKITEDGSMTTPSADNNKAFMLFGYQHQLSVASSMQSINNTLNADKNRLINDLNSNFYKVLFRGGFNERHFHLYDKNDNLAANADTLGPNSRLLTFLNNLSGYLGG
jgi:hypothetical protein